MFATLEIENVNSQNNTTFELCLPGVAMVQFRVYNVTSVNMVCCATYIDIYYRD